MSTRRRLCQPPAWAAAALCLASTAAPALTCDELRDQIAAKYRANGVRDVQLQVLDASAAASAAGRTVGSCDRGARRIVLARGAATSAPRPAGGDDILTECRDGRVLRGGSCR